jgi:arsenate reductase-like glutaredoxin family protein
MTCTRTQEFLAKNKIAVTETIDAKKKTRGRKEALELVKDVDEVVASKGKKVVRFNLKKDNPSEDELAAVLLGPTGNLRAPTFKLGRTLMIGFSEEAYAERLK